MLKIKRPGEKSMESSDVKSKQSSSREEIGDMKKKSSAANVRNTDRTSNIRVLYEYQPEPEKTERKKSTEVIIVPDRKSLSKHDIDTNIKGDTKQGNEGDNVLPRKSLSKNVSNAESPGVATLEAIFATPSTSNATNKIKTNESHMKTEDIVKAKKIIKAAKNNKISHATMMTRGRLKKIQDTEYDVSADDYLSVQSIGIHFNVQDLRSPGLKKRLGTPMKRQVKKMKK